MLVGINTGDDAAVYRISDELALVQTVDFFPPVVDDAYSYGAIAAANSLSDLYAKGARPIMALNIVSFPTQNLPQEVLVNILKGGADKAAEAGIAIVGGHTLDERTPMYGLVVTGVAHPKKVVTNAAARPGDQLVLTKPLGIGAITTALKVQRAPADVVSQAVAVMSRLNRDASEAMLRVGVNACTDVTGFGLLGHLLAMLTASSVGAKVYRSKVPVIPGTWELIAKKLTPGGTKRNMDFVNKSVVWERAFDEDTALLLCDPQTSGGLLMSVPPERTQKLLSDLAASRVEAALIGEVLPGPQVVIRIVP